MERVTSLSEWNQDHDIVGGDHDESAGNKKQDTEAYGEGAAVRVMVNESKSDRVR